MKQKGIDSHCHLNFKQFDEDRDDVISRTKEKLERVVNPGANPNHNREAKKLSEKHPEFVEFNTGLHPVYKDDFSKLDEVKQQIIDFDPCAIGEIGLDHYHITSNSSRRRQKQVFEELLGLAESENKPVVLHTRDAEKDVLDILTSYAVEGVFLHCFNGSKELCREAIDRGYYVGITTQVLYSDHVQNLVEEVSLDKLLLETDSPYLYRGSRNEPRNIIESAEKIANLRSVSKERVLDHSTKNAFNFYDF